MTYKILYSSSNMRTYTDSNLYQEILKDFNYRYPKFSPINYPSFKQNPSNPTPKENKNNV